MKCKNIFAMAAALTMASMMSSCSGTANDESPAESLEIQQTEPASEEVAEEPTEPTTEEELIPPTPVDCDDPNAVTFDDGDFSFARPKTTDKDSAQGELAVVEIQGNKMLKFVDSGTNFADGTVQKIEIDAAKLLSPENLAKVRSIECDIYADATADLLKTEDSDNVLAPGWVGGGGGANVVGDKWYQFGEWSVGEYNFDMSGAAHYTMKFLLAAGGKCWDETMTEGNFLVMRWGAQNEGNFYLDNIVFFDEDGNSLPIEKSAPNENPDEQDTESAETTEAESAEETTAAE